MNRSVSSVNLHQPSFPGLCPITSAVQELATAAGAEARGAVFTRKEIVEFILDLVGYRQDRPLFELRLLEPSFGAGDFIFVAVERLLATWRCHAKKDDCVTQLGPCIRAVELHHETFHNSRLRLIELLGRHEVSPSNAAALADQWLVHGDFLLVSLDGGFDVVIGNPPYVRQELIPDALLEEYRNRYTTIYDRADLYIPFIERSLRSLTRHGKLGFICADRWMKNRYGGPLRKLIAEQFQLRVYVDMVDTPAFHSEVIAYPAIMIIGREKTGFTRVTHRPSVDSVTLSRLAADLNSKKTQNRGIRVREITDVAVGSEPWVLDSPEQMALVRRLEKEFPAIEAAGCKVGIGVATGADKAFIGRFEDLDVEADRKLPLVMTRDILTGEVHWRGLGVVNPFADTGGLVDLDEYPRLKRYLEDRKSEIADRHCAQKAPANWYRTIDRITPSLVTTPKLLIPDIKGDAQIVYEQGKLYPHHNLYFITSAGWDLRALQAVLLSGIARLFIAVYSTKMRGGYLRFQAQYLRRIHIPHWDDVSETYRSHLREAAVAKDVAECNRVASGLYGLSEQERTALSHGSE